MYYLPKPKKKILVLNRSGNFMWKTMEIATKNSLKNEKRKRKNLFDLSNAVKARYP